MAQHVLTSAFSDDASDGERSEQDEASVFYLMLSFLCEAETEL